MHVVAICSTKGGVGKTTLTAHLAAEIEAKGGGPVAIIDADPQASLARWWNTRSADTPRFIQTDLKGLPKQIQALSEADFSMVLIDTPGADVSHTRLILKNANLVLIPSRPSPLDLGTLASTVGMVEAENKPLMFVLNGVTPRTRISAQAVQALSLHGPIAAILHQRTDYASSMTDGRVASELDPSSRSAQEIADLWTEVSKCLRKQSSKATREEVRI